MIESRAVVNAGDSSELLLSICTESLRWMESARAMESMTCLAESEMEGTSGSESEMASTVPSLRSLLRRLSSCEDKLKELNSSRKAAMSHSLSR